MGEPCSVSAVRGAEPRHVLEAVESCFDGWGVAHARRADEEARAADVLVSEARDGWTTVTWPPYFLPRDVTACRAISRELRTVVSAVTTTDHEGWSQTLFGSGTVLDRFHSYPASLAWDGVDVTVLADEWSGDHELVARVFGVPDCGVRRHFCPATPATRDHPGRDRLGYLALWSALGIRVPDSRAPYAALAVDPSWQRLSVPPA